VSTYQKFCPHCKEFRKPIESKNKSRLTNGKWTITKIFLMAFLSLSALIVIISSLFKDPKVVTENYPKAIEKAISTPAEESCYDLGYRFGSCATRSMHGLTCKPENDIIIPVRCRGKAETERGLKAAVKDVNTALKQKPAIPKSSYSIDIITMPLPALRSKLKGKTKSEVKRLVGRPDRVEYFSGDECWIYGKSRTTEDVGIVFRGNIVFTVTYY
jgi:hypothetical protein